MSINEIAKALNVSKSTVSQVINGKSEQGRISKELSKRILDYVEKIGYKPNALAKSLATGKSQSIGLIVENIGDSFFGPIALYIEEELRQHGYHVFYSSTMGDSILSSEIIQSFISKRVEGIILSPTLDMESHIEKMVKNKFPLVIFDRKCKSVETNYVGTDNYQASKSVVQHLLDNEYKNIAYISIESSQSQMIDRENAYLDILKEKGVQPVIFKTPFFFKSEQRVDAIKDFLLKNIDIDALYFSTNYLCIAGIKAINSDQNLCKPAIVVFDDHELFEFLSPTITCIKQPLRLIAQAVVQNLLRQIEKNNYEIDQCIIPSNLIIRKSSLKK